ncbi:MAG: hypothetical protein PHO78_04195 [Methanomicrobium sp.]|nr:hypothetical protein [Methanomicrobium sp.]
MDKLDWITFLAAIVIVVVLALIVNLPKMTADAEVSGEILSDISADSCRDGSCCMPKTHYYYETSPKTGPLKINYNNNYQEIYSQGLTGYPRLHFSDTVKNPSGDVNAYDKNLYNTGFKSIYGTSDIFVENIWQAKEITPFSYMSGSTSGFSEIFGVPYSLWRISSSFVPKGNPAYSSFTWVLIDSSTGDIITGANVLPGEKIVKKLEISNLKYYFLIEALNVESFNLSLETPKMAYDEAHINPRIDNLKNFLNTM